TGSGFTTPREPTSTGAPRRRSRVSRPPRGTPPPRKPRPARSRASRACAGRAPGHARPPARRERARSGPAPRPPPPPPRLPRRGRKPEIRSGRGEGREVGGKAVGVPPAEHGEVARLGDLVVAAEGLVRPVHEQSRELAVIARQRHERPKEPALSPQRRLAEG